MEVLEGNTQDITTLPRVVNDLKQRFGLTTCHLVFERGMVSADHLNLLEAEGLTYLSAMDKDEMACHPFFQEFVPEPASKEDYEQILALHEFLPTDDYQFFYTREGMVEKRRFIFSFDVTRFFEDIATLSFAHLALTTSFWRDFFSDSQLGVLFGNPSHGLCDPSLSENSSHC